MFICTILHMLLKIFDKNYLFIDGIMGFYIVMLFCINYVTVVLFAVDAMYVSVFGTSCINTLLSTFLYILIALHVYSVLFNTPTYFIFSSVYSRCLK